MKIRNYLFVNYIITALAVVLSLLHVGDKSSMLMWIGFPQWFALILILGYFHARNVLKAAGHSGDLKDSVSVRFSQITLAAWFFVSIALSYGVFISVGASVFDQLFITVCILSNVMALCIVGILIYILYPLQVKFNAGVYKKLID